MNRGPYSVFFKKSALKELQLLPERIQRRVLDAANLLAINPFTELLQIKKLKGDDLNRIRLQGYRMIYHIENQRVKITVIKVARRKEAYD